MRCETNQYIMKNQVKVKHFKMKKYNNGNN